MDTLTCTVCAAQHFNGVIWGGTGTTLSDRLRIKLFTPFGWHDVWRQFIMREPTEAEKQADEKSRIENRMKARRISALDHAS